MVRDQRQVRVQGRGDLLEGTVEEAVTEGAVTTEAGDVVETLGARTRLGDSEEGETALNDTGGELGDAVWLALRRVQGSGGRSQVDDTRREDTMKIE